MEGRYNGSGRTEKKTETAGFQASSQAEWFRIGQLQAEQFQVGRFRIRHIQARQYRKKPEPGGKQNRKTGCSPAAEAAAQAHTQ